MRTTLLYGTPLCLMLVLTANADNVALPPVPLSVVAQSDTQSGIPVVPLTPAEKDLNEAVPPPAPTPATPPPPASAPPTITRAEPDAIMAPPLSVTNDASNIVVVPGITEIVPAALGHLNRIVTPFAHPQIKTTSSALTRVDGNVAYVAPKTLTPVALYLTEKGDESIAISITLVPRRIPPREIRLRFGPTGGGGTMPIAATAKKWEESYPYEKTVRNLLVSVARGEIPSGYNLDGKPRNARPFIDPESARQGIRFDFSRAQLVSGAHFELLIGIARNVGKNIVELREPWLAADGVAAVAFWPNNMLEPGRSTEAYVLYKRGTRNADSSRKRESLLVNY